MTIRHLCFLLCLSGGVLIAVCNPAAAQAPVDQGVSIESTDRDPTVPTGALLDRINAMRRSDIEPIGPAPSQATVAVAPPQCKLKSIILRDPDNGMALIEAGTKRFFLPLERSAIHAPKSTEAAGQEGAVQRSRFQLQDTIYTVVDFTAHSITVRSGPQVFVIQ